MLKRVQRAALLMQEALRASRTISQSIMLESETTDVWTAIAVCLH